MNDYLDELGRQLRLATDKHHQDNRSQIARGPRISSPRLILVLTLAVLAIAAAALAATTILQTGSPVKQPRGASSTAGVGIPVLGASRILPLREPDPAGGLPWGMRVIRTTRGLLCVQVGRVYHGRLGLLGRDGAFGNDGRFHPLSADALTAQPGSLGFGSLGPAGSIQTCGPPATTFSQSASEIQPSGVMPHTRIVPTGQQRWISYGILGPHAQTVVYLARGQQLSRAVLRPLGAYLIVLPGSQPGLVGPQGGGSSGAGQINTPRPGPAGAVTEITYRFGSKRCTDASQPGSANSCPVATSSLSSDHERQLHQPIAVRLRHHSPAFDAIVSFRAPYRVVNSLSDYVIEIPSPCHGGGGGANIDTPIERDIKTGQLVTTTLQDVFANACGPTVTLRVLYQANSRIDPLGPRVVVGQTTITRGG